MDKEKVFSDANSLFNSVLENFYSTNSSVQIEIENNSPLLKRRKKSKAEIAYDKFTESTLNDNESVESCKMKLKISESDQNVTVSTDILNKIQIIEHKLATTESLWGNALKQLTALQDLATSVKKSNEIKSNKVILGDHRILIILPTLPVKNLNELIELDKAICNSDAVAQSVKSILEDGDESKYHDNHSKFIKWNIGKLIKPEVAIDVSWSNQNGFQLKNSSVIKILIKRINTKFPMLSYIYIVEQILAVLIECRSANKNLKRNSTNICTEMS